MNEQNIAANSRQSRLMKKFGWSDGDVSVRYKEIGEEYPEYNEKKKSKKSSRFSKSTLSIPAEQRIDIAEVGRILASQYTNRGKDWVTPDNMIKSWTSSKYYYLMKIPIWTVRPFEEIEPGKHSHSDGPIIVDALKEQRKTRYGSFLSSPNLMIIDGKHRRNDALERGEREIMAYVGDTVHGEMVRLIFRMSAPRDRFEKTLDAYYRKPDLLSWQRLVVAGKECGLSAEQIRMIEKEYKDGNVFNLDKGEYETIDQS